MERKVNDIITYNFKGEDIYLEVIPTKANSCEDCFFYKNEKTHCYAIRNIIGICDKNDRTDKTPVIFRKVMKKKKTIDIYVVMQVHKEYRSFCGVFTSFEEANTRFEILLKNFKKIYKVQPREWTIECLPSQIKVFIIGDITLYLCKETKEIDIEVNSNEPIFDEPIFDEPKFRSFFSSYNCFNESIKHVPFGILTNEENIYFTILSINNDGISVIGDKGKIDFISFKDASKLFNYVDGSPFGYII